MDQWIEIKEYKDLPKYGQFVLVCGIDKRTYNIRGLHVCEMNDLEDGIDWRTKGTFFWLTENGTKIENVTHWTTLPPIPTVEEMRKHKINKILKIIKK